MTSRDRHNAWLLGKSGIIETRLEVWQAAERDMLDRCIERVNQWSAARTPDGGGLALRNCAIALKELLND